MKILLRVVMLVAWLCVPGVVWAQGSSLLVLSKQEHSLAIVDPSSLKVVAKVPVGNDPLEVIASADGTTAYVSNYGFGAYNTLAVIDLVGYKALPAIDLGPLRGPHGLTFVGEDLVHCGGGEGYRSLRSRHAEGRLDSWYGAKSDAHDLCVGRSAVDCYQQCQLRHGEHH